jgi:hypothetical protein
MLSIEVSRFIFDVSLTIFMTNRPPQFWQRPTSKSSSASRAWAQVLARSASFYCRDHCCGLTICRPARTQGIDDFRHRCERSATFPRRNHRGSCDRLHTEENERSQDAASTATARAATAAKPAARRTTYLGGCIRHRFDVDDEQLILWRQMKRAVFNWQSALEGAFPQINTRARSILISCILTESRRAGGRKSHT